MCEMLSLPAVFLCTPTVTMHIFISDGHGLFYIIS